MKQPRKHLTAWPAIAAMWLALGAAAWGATETTSPAVAASNTAGTAVPAPPPATRAARPTYNTFSNIARVNIFNSWRSPGGNNEGEGPKKVAPANEKIALTGTMNYPKGGTMAFFDGSQSEYRKVLRKDALIGEFKITEITHHGAKLEKGEEKYELKVGMQLSRPPGGDWTVSMRTDTYFGSTESSGDEENSRMFSRNRNRFESGDFGGDSGGGGGRRGRNRGDSGGIMTFTAPSSTPSSSPAASTSSPAEVNDILKKLMEAREKETR